MIVVLDASAAVRSAMDSSAPFRVPLEAADLVIAPELIVAEVCSAFRKYVRARVLSRRQAEELVERSLALVDEMQPMRQLVGDVNSLSGKLDSSVYDLFYLALAVRTDATLITGDAALRRHAIKIGVDAPE